MAFAAILAAENVDHPDFGASGFRWKWIRVAIRARQPFSVRTVREFHEGHFFRVAHDDVEVEDVHFFVAVQVAARFDQTRFQGPHPVWKAVGVVGQVAGGLFDALQALAIRVVLVEKLHAFDCPTGSRYGVLLDLPGCFGDGRLRCCRAQEGQ